MRLLLTGTPGCGKTVLGKKIAALLKAKLVDVNAVVEKNKICRRSARGEKIVDLKKLEGILKGILAREKNVVAESHLLCELPLQCDRIIILRCDPLVLKKRLEKRGYAPWKVKENVLAEMLDYCSIKTEGNYAKSRIVEIDFSKPLPAARVLAKSKSDSVDWMGEFGVLEKKINGFWK